MKIALVRPFEPRKSIASEVVQQPVNLLRLAACCNDAGHDCRVWDLALNDFDPNNFAKMLDDFSPALIGFSCVTPTIKTGAMLAGLAKSKQSNLITIVGGPHVSALPGQTLEEFSQFDIGVVGEGETTLTALADALDNALPLSQIEGIVYREDGLVCTTKKRELIQDLDTLPYPDRSLVNLSDYIGSSSPGLSTSAKRITQLFTSRGCPARCPFCASDQVHGGRVRFHSAKYILAEAEKSIAEQGIEHFTIEDDTFTFGSERLIEICQGLKKLGVTWDCDSRVDTVDPQILKVMADSGCVKIAFGVESGSEKILQRINKNIDKQMIENAISWAKQAGIETSAFVMVGADPEETRGDLDATLSFMKKVAPDYLMVYCAVPYPGTKLRSRMSDLGLIDSDDWDEYDIVRTKPVWRTLNFSPEKIVKMQKQMYQRYYFRPSYILKRLSKLKNLKGLWYTIRAGLMLAKYSIAGRRS